jgi:hypothetical protein
MIERDCDTCQHHSQTTLDPRCGDCFRSTKYLPLWEAAKDIPMEYPVTNDGLCKECRYYFQPSQLGPCNICGTGGKFYWQPADATPASNDGSTADYYTLPEGATELQDLIASRDMNAQMGEIFRACYRYGQGHHSPRERDLKKIIFYAQAELDRLEKYDH